MSFSRSAGAMMLMLLTIPFVGSAVAQSTSERILELQ